MTKTRNGNVKTSQKKSQTEPTTEREWARENMTLNRSFTLYN